MRKWLVCVAVLMPLWATTFAGSTMNMVLTDPALADTMPNWPGAQGFGARALDECWDSVYYGGDGVADNADDWSFVVHRVTSKSNLAATAGSLWDILANDIADNQLDWIVFDVGGDPARDGNTGADLHGHKCVVVNARSAPGDGFTIESDSGATANVLRLGDTNTDNPVFNIVLSYLRIWKYTCLGADTVACPDNGDLVSIYNGKMVHLNHLELFGGHDEAISIASGRGSSTGIQDVSISRSIGATVFSDALGGACVVTSNGAAAPFRRVDFYQNFLTESNYRTPCNPSQGSHRTPPQDSIENLQQVNNMVYGWGSRVQQLDVYAAPLSIVSNVFKSSTSGTDVDEILEINGDHETQPDTSEWRVWFEGNRHTGGTCGNTTANWWTNCVVKDGTGTAIGVDSVGHVASARGALPVIFSWVPIDTATLYDTLVVAERVGIDRLLNCDGSLRTIDEPISDSLFQHAKDSVAPWNSLPGNGDLPFLFSAVNLSEGTACTDTDSDGMPNEWEKLHFALADTNRANATENPDGDLFPNIVEFFGGEMGSTDPNVFTQPDGTEPSSFAPTYNAGTDSAFSIFRLIQRAVSIITGGGADTLNIRRVSRDTIPLGSLFDVHPDCIIGDTVLLASQDTLIVGSDTITALTQAQIDSLATAWGLPATCTSTSLEQRKVSGIAARPFWQRMIVAMRLAQEMVWPLLR